jgi:hypothetical protein
VGELGPVAWPPGPIGTERLVLREPEARDRAGFIELFASPEVNTERLPDPVVDGTPVRAGPLFSGAGGRIVSRPADAIDGALLLVSADDGDSWLPTLVPN